MRSVGFTFLLFAVVVTAGCESSPRLSADVTLLSIRENDWAGVRREIRNSTNDPEIEQLIEEYKVHLRKIAEELKIPQGEDGSYPLDADREAMGAEVVQAPHKTVEEFEIDMPAWTEKLHQRSKAGELSDESREIYARIVLAELLGDIGNPN